MTAEALDEFPPPDDDARLGAAEQLVAGEADEIRPGGERLPRRRLVLEGREGARAEVVDERQGVTARHRRQLLDTRLLREADDTKVRLVHAQEQRRLRPDRGLVVGRPRAVRRPDLDEAGSRAGENVRDPEPVADLDQLAARDDHLAAVRERGEGEHDGRRVVIDDERRLGSRQPSQDPGRVILPRAAPTGREVVLEVRVAARHLLHPCERGVWKRRPAEVRVDDDAGGVEEASKLRAPSRRELGADPLPEVARVAPRADLLPGEREDRPRGVDGGRVRVAGETPVARKLVDGGEIAQLHYRSRSTWVTAIASASATTRPP